MRADYPVRMPTYQKDLALHQKIDEAARQRLVYISGECGAGKAAIARLIHQRSVRSAGPFITVDCASLPRDLIESELFGSAQFTELSSLSNRLGSFDAAAGGTLFLDGICDLPLHAQPKLVEFLRQLDLRDGYSTTQRRLDICVVSASRLDLAELCNAGCFRDDLYQLLNHHTLPVMPLRDVPSGIPLIATEIMTSICQRQNIACPQLSSDATAKLVEYRWPGNVRELERVLERALAFSTSKILGADDIELHSLPHHVYQTMGASAQDAKRQFTLAGKSLEEIEKQAIVDTLKHCDGNKAKSARLLGISEKSIYNKMRRLKINNKPTNLSAGDR